MYTCGFRINTNLVKEGSSRINAKLVKKELNLVHKFKDILFKHVVIGLPAYWVKLMIISNRTHFTVQSIRPQANASGRIVDLMNENEASLVSNQLLLCC